MLAVRADFPDAPAPGDIVVMNATVAVAVHDHVHLARAGHAVVRIGAMDAPVGQVPDARALAVDSRPLRVAYRVQLGLEFLPLVAQQFRALRLRGFLLLQPGSELLVLPVHIGGDLLANQFKEAVSHRRSFPLRCAR